jgi:hypothetical protein
MEDSALMMSEPHLADTKTSRLYENCRDSSLTVEDAELCERRAGAIKLLTRAAVATQIAQAPPVVPHETSSDAEYLKDEANREQLAAEALVGREFMDRPRYKSRFTLVRRVRNALSAAKHKLNSLQKEIPFTYVSDKARRQQLVNTYNEYMPSGSKVVCTCDHDNAGDEENEGLNPNVKPACTCKGGSLTKFTGTEQGGVLDTGPKGAWPQGLPPQSKIDGYGADAYKARPQQLVSVSAKHAHPMSAKHVAAKRPAAAHAQAAKAQQSKHAIKMSAHATPPHAVAGAQKPQQHKPAATSTGKTNTAMSQLDVLKHAVEAANKDKKEALQGDAGDKNLLALEDKITKTEQKLAERKRQFRHELEKRQVTLINDFHNEMKEIQDGIQLATGATVPIGEQSSLAMLGEANSAMTQDQNTHIAPDGPALAAAREADFGDVARVENAAVDRSVGLRPGETKSSVIVKEIMQRVKQSRCVCASSVVFRACGSSFATGL